MTAFNPKCAAASKEDNPLLIHDIRELLGIPHPRSHGFVESLPFSLNDTTAGSEAELQVAVCGKKDHVDLPSTIANSIYYANIVRRALTGDTSELAVTDLEKYVDSNSLFLSRPLQFFSDCCSAGLLAPCYVRPGR